MKRTKKIRKGGKGNVQGASMSARERTSDTKRSRASAVPPPVSESPNTETKKGRQCRHSPVHSC